MITLVLSACPVGLRGDLTKWLLEISPGVFVGQVSARLRDNLWDRVLDQCKEGRAIMVFPSGREQRFEFKVHRHDWEPVDFDGLTLIKRTAATNYSPRKTGWSNASNGRRARTPSWTKARDAEET
ncbi:type I-E CRISPR-associated endoribonuclease Cas2e [Brevibacterium sp.]|uniref:type I-E CRISPR-associated endoribonuclease Cas2e n=1 Tax=Brevibacterium sp. TaxID=1701 RepID=UPI002811E5F2|nr:type I-E CRISPR-associated endoribonuclease Cas2e [Brevibacterium sp.]